MGNTVSIRWGDMVVVETYLSPSMNMKNFEEALDELERWIPQVQDKPTFVIGDFNDKTHMWQSRTTDLRGIQVAEWASRLGMYCLNHGGKNTCVRVNGKSIIDMTFANPLAASRVTHWTVSDKETKSDHRYIEITIRSTRMQEVTHKVSSW
ncbi:hypothetical protein ALC57_05326 [Trachymyrmex cornetzi]|uniref:Endonuclease/exonuclease/phosphatase domain-containing protein n=1 Tax=Trachymyrmex cornetzi TaxID=471704 RepID=A0A151JB29_9HYME|nr:hypothetical protein ALC57_05326 [Trachymyrmex cornetzi]